MGSASSKHQETPNSLKASLSRSVSMPAHSGGRMEGGKMPWKSRVSSMLHSRKKDFSQNVVQEEMHSVDYQKIVNADDSTVNSTHRNKPELSSSGHITFPNHLDESCQSFTAHSTRTCRDGCNACVEALGLQSCLVYDGIDLFPTDLSIGLRLLLSPGTPSSKNFVSPTRDVSLEASLVRQENHRVKSNAGCLLEAPSRKVSVLIVADKARPHANDSRANKVSDTQAGISPFDPCVLASFEKAVEDSYIDCWQSSEVSNTSKNAMSSLELFSVADKCELQQENGVEVKTQAVVHKNQLKKKASLFDSNPVLSDVFTFAVDKGESSSWSKEDYLGLFRNLCPPGCESKIVLYFTSLRAVRKTFEDGFMMRLILKGLRVQVDERDVWMHSKFRQELTDVMGSSVTVPRLFIMGRHIGGARELEVLHEEGILVKLVEGLPKCYRGSCSLCADVRFIPCTECRGSCKTITHNNVVVRCLNCNENGLMMCNLCGG